MQWMDVSDGGYGEDPYAGAGYAYAYGNEYNGNVTTGTATMPQGPGQPAQWTHATGDAYATGTDPYATSPNLYILATDHYVAGPSPAMAAWEAPHCDAVTMPPPEFDTPGAPASVPNPPKSESVSPVFVDSSGRRQRRVLRAARLLVIPAGGYAALLVSAVLGGPSLNAPFVPQPDSTHPTKPHASAPDASPGGQSAGSVRPTAAQKNSRSTTVQKTSGSTSRSTASTTSAAASVPAAVPTGVASPTSTSAPTAAPTSTPTSKGRALGSSHNPVK
ncbi:hypothetical protein GCM10023335_10210 [Streptomyces siamensis]|uniref:Uncharacterized protein n=1 Tax=Streptomyces siamensis TaxID=1274986 RepID=A0ABP9IHZ3_9ACTN